MSWPGDLLKSEFNFEKLKQAHREQVAREKVEAEKAADRSWFMGNKVWNFDVTQSAYQLDKEYGRDWDLKKIQAVVSDPTVPLDRRARLVEVMILRGAQGIPYDNLIQFQETMGENEKLRETADYQLAATMAVLNGGAPMLAALSADHNPLPSGRAVATEWMHMALREGGTMASFEARENLKDWIMKLDPESRGMAMYHAVDAAGMADVQRPARLTGAELGVGPFSGGIQWDKADTHWKEAVRHIEMNVATGLDKSPEQEQRFWAGYDKADTHLGGRK